MTTKLTSKVLAKHVGPDKKSDPAIDVSVLRMLKSLDLQEHGVEFSERVTMFADKIAVNLKSLRASIGMRDFRLLETLACELSANALMVGAVKILSSSYALQNAARLGDMPIAVSIADQLELEFVWAKQGLEEAIGQV